VKDARLRGDAGVASLSSARSFPPAVQRACHA
jgi:hypothetical protein